MMRNQLNIQEDPEDHTPPGIQIANPKEVQKVQKMLNLFLITWIDVKLSVLYFWMNKRINDILYSTIHAKLKKSSERYADHFVISLTN